ncbi:MAG TPA: nicotinamidase, partial [Chloroflexota bacterium]|nr:nicotinamidase [Chloroflexota bacterium]
YILTDCMSSVVVRDPDGVILADFTAEAEQSLQEFADAGMHLVRSTDPVADWAG